ncbi:MAG: citrate lyase acyl carrier protein [Candidatus Izemoplasmatales bacterium]
MKKGIAGSKESSDCLISVSEAKEQSIEINSSVGAFFYQQIKQVVMSTLEEKGLTNVSVIVDDRGALDQTIKARLLVAIERMREDD